MMVYCPHCGLGHKITRRESLYIDINGYCARDCMECRQIYYFNYNGAVKERKYETCSI